MSTPENAVNRMVKASGARSKLAREIGVSVQSIFQWEKAGWMPLARAKQVMEMYPGVASLRDLVRSDLRAAMDISTQEALLD